MNENLIEQKNKLFFILLILLTIFLMGESVLVIYKMKGEETIIPSASFDKTQAFLKIDLEKDQLVKLNKNLKAQITLSSTNEAINGADVILRFDPKLISIIDIVGNHDVFKQIIVNQQQQKEGRIKITAYSPLKTIQGKYVLASLTLRLLENRSATLGFEFLGPGQPRDSGLISHKSQQDILQQVYPLILEPGK